MSLVDDLRAAKAQFTKLNGKSIQGAHSSACWHSSTALSSLVALRDALPSPFTDFREFENSRHWRRKDAYAVFDRAIAAAESAP